MDQVAHYNVVSRFIRYFGEVAGGFAAITSVEVLTHSQGPIENGGKLFFTFESPPLR